MARIRSKDWDGLVAEWIALKALEPLLTHEEFYRRKDLDPRVARKRIGVRMTQEWDKVRKSALDKVQKRAALDLANELTDALKVSKALMGRGTEAVFGNVRGPVGDQLREALNEARQKGDSKKARELEGKLGIEVRPDKFQDAVGAIRSGMAGIHQVARILSGGEPLVQPAEVTATFRWNEPAKNATGKAPKKRKAAKEEAAAIDGEE